MKNSVLSHLPGDFPWQVHWFDTIVSTNDRAKSMARAGAPHGTVLIAEQQTGGRGRMGRSFSSPRGGVYLSVILRPGHTAGELMHLTCAAAVAMCDAVETVSGLRPGVKWINDLIADDKKLGGILTELCVDPNGKVQYAVIGAGINCREADLPAELRDMAISLDAATGKTIDTSRLTAAIIHALYHMDTTLIADKAALMDVYRKDCVTLGKDITIVNNDNRRCGTAIDLDDDGGLLVRFADGSTQTVNSGEVSIRGMCGYL